MATKTDKAKKQQIQIQIPDGVERYVNFVMVNHSHTEFVLDHMFLMGGQTSGKVAGRMIMAPANAKRLALTLNENIKRYEQVFGTIEAPKPAKMESPIH